MIAEPFGGGEFRDADNTMYGELQAQTVEPPCEMDSSSLGAGIV